MRPFFYIFSTSLQHKERKELAGEKCEQDLDVLEQRQWSAPAVTRSGMVSKQSGEIELGLPGFVQLQQSKE